MKNYYLYILAAFFFFFDAPLDAQTYVLKAIPTENNKDMFHLGGETDMELSSSIREKMSGRHFKNRMIYISDNDAYYTFVPYLRDKSDSLLYKYTDVPLFTYLRGIDLFLEKKEDSILIHKKEDFANKFRFEAVNEFKNYLGVTVQKYKSKNNFYETYFWVAENSNASNNEYVVILKDLGLLNLESNKSIVAINYLGIEFPIEYMSLERKSRQNLNEELFEDTVIGESSKAQEEVEQVYKEVSNQDEIKYLLNKPHSFQYKRQRTDIDLNFDSNRWESDIYLNKENKNRIQFSNDRFYALFDDYLIQGKVESNGDLIYESSKKRIKSQENNSVDLSDRKLLYLNKNKNIIDFCVQDTKEFWGFMRYSLITDSEDFEHLNTKIILPNGRTIEGLISRVVTFNAGYNNSHYEYSTNSSEIEELNEIKTYVIKE
ncbi:MAG: hypothetical protein KDD26_06730 [Winogradskyella sp.]|nr:hypothetical protein [Winogradskyella sp.]